MRPCASTWLGAGIAYLRLQDYDNADVALMEANVMNNRHAEVWGYLALLALHTGQAAEAEQATMWALRCELCNTQLLDEIGEQYMTLEGQLPLVHMRRLSPQMVLRLGVLGLDMVL